MLLAADIAGRVSSASSLLGLVLVMITLFTGDLVRRYDSEQDREGGPSVTQLWLILVLMAALTLVTALIAVALTPVGVDSIQEYWNGGRDPAFLMFAVAWGLLVPLTAWQALVATRAFGDARAE